ncbi:MAG: [FeFe] hydrogenase H-cluster maturation GTPase HydF [candidate division Zixibacteria bacterium]|nr:[FeFe] hydrogenase H-cluster maturation GTPase HydF [candidate division Zixibacteria bacterium]
MQKTPRGMRLHIGIFGRRNVGKSSLLNALTRQQVSIVSEIAGTTTDPVEKPMEFLPLGPVLFVDTAGIDDEGILGEMRVKKTRKVIDRVDLAILVLAGQWGKFEQQIVDELKSRSIPIIAAINKIDQVEPSAETIKNLESNNIRWVKTRADKGEGILALRELLLSETPADFLEPRGILSDLVGPGGMAVLVIPIDKEAPKGRLILPQVQSIRDLLDHDATCVVTTDKTLRIVFEQLKVPPKLVVTDSQAFEKVNADTPPDIPLTGFSVLFSRFRGDLLAQVEGTLAVDSLKPGDRILVAEACTHHPIGDDIGRVKIPNWLNKYIGGKLDYTTIQGHDFPEDVTPYKLVIHCGACTINRKEVLNRIIRCRNSGVPFTNYGLVIAYSLGLFERALGPFPEALMIYNQAKQSGKIRK